MAKDMVGTANSKRATGGAGEVSGYPNMKQSEMEAYARYGEDGGEGPNGSGTPVGDRAASVSKHFKVERGASQGEDVKISDGVDLASGKANYAAGGPR